MELSNSFGGHGLLDRFCFCYLTDPAHENALESNHVDVDVACSGLGVSPADLLMLMFMLTLMR